MTRFTHDTWLQDEEYAYPHGHQTRKGAALYPDGKIRRVYAGIPDTYFTIPAHGRLHGRYLGGWVSIDADSDSPTCGALVFRPLRRYEVTP